jgi:hypothetical protein
MNPRLLHRLLHPFLVTLALIFLFEAWLWNRLSPIVAWVVDCIPLARLKQRLAAGIERLPPALTLVVFIVPFLLLLPLKFLEVWFLTHRNWIGAIAVLIAVKLLGVGVTAFIFDATRPKLLQLAWFCSLYTRVMIWLAWAHELVDPVKRRVKIWLQLFSPQRAGRALRLFRRIRRRMYAQAR